MSVTIQYTGFELKARGREYSYRVIAASAEPREFTMTISNRAFETRRLPYQDGAALCYEKLKKDLLAESENSKLAGRVTISDEDLDAYLQLHRPSRKRL
jgi:hypothetical protein